MPDPTVTILKAAFLIALGLFVVVAGIRALMRRRNPVILDAFGNATVSPPSIPRGKVPVWLYHPLDSLWMGLIFLIFVGLTLADAGAPAPEKEKNLTAGVLLFSIGFQITLAFLTTLFVARRLAPVSWLGLNWPHWRKIFWLGPACVVGMWMFFIGLQLIGLILWTALSHLQSTGVTGWTNTLLNWMNWFGNNDMQDSVKLLRSANDPTILGLMTLAAVVVAPICEEIVFRGYLYPAAKKFAGPWIAGLCSALVFSAAHGNLPALIPLFAFGCVLAFIYEKSGSILLPIAVHLCFNGATVGLQMLDRIFNFLPVPPP
jgi:membrane protease YdiL (CAAX protease family)